VLLSVVMPTHNVATWLPDAIESVLAQEVESLELIIVDDRSTDGSAEIIAKYASQDSRIRVTKMVGSGGGRARNAGVTAAAGDYLVFADGDDIVPRGAYPALLKSLRASGSEFAVGKFLKFSIDRTWNPTAKWRFVSKPHRGAKLADLPDLIRNRAVWNKMFRLDFWESTGVRFSDAVRSNDIVPMVRVMLEANEIDVVTDNVYLYRERPGATSMSNRAAGLAGLLSYLQEERNCLELLVSATQSGALAPPVLRDYFNMFYNSDGWLHLRKAAIALSTADAKTLAKVAQQVRVFALALEHTGNQSIITKTPRNKILVFELAEADEANLLVNLAADGSFEWQRHREVAVSNVLESAGELLERLVSLNSVRPLSQRYVKAAFLSAVVEPLLEVYEDFRPADWTSLAIAVTSLATHPLGEGISESDLAPHHLGSLPSVIAIACRRHDVEFLPKLVAAGAENENWATDLRVGRGSLGFTLNLMGFSGVTKLTISARNEQTGRFFEFPLHETSRVSTDDYSAAFDVSIQLRRFNSAGFWKLSLSYADELRLIAFTRAILTTEIPPVRASRLSSAAAFAPLNKKDGMLRVLKPQPLLTRLLRKAAAKPSR